MPGDVVDSLVVNNGGMLSRAFNVPICTAAITDPVRLGDTRTDCTVHNNRLDEEDIDLDNVLNLPSSARDREQLLRFVVDLGDSRKWVRFGKSFTQRVDATSAPRTLQWVLVRIPFRSADDTLNNVLLRRVRALRVTMVSGAGLADNEFSQVPLARLCASPARHGSTRSNQTTLPGIAGIASNRLDGSFVIASTIGTNDSSATVVYQPPPGVQDQSDSKAAQIQVGRTQINETSMRIQAGSIQAGNMPLYHRAETYYRFPAGPQSFLLGFRQLRVWGRGRGNGWGQNGDLQMFVKLGRDENNFYLYRAPMNAGPDSKRHGIPRSWRSTSTGSLRCAKGSMADYLAGKKESITCGPGQIRRS